MMIHWENRQGLGLLQSFIKTWTNSLNRPSEFFRSLPKEGNFAKPMTYSITILCAGIILSALYQLVFQGAVLSLLGSVLDSSQLQALFVQGSMQGVFFVFTVLASPIQAAINLFLYSVIYHVVLKLLGGANFNYEASFRAYAYSRGPLLFSLVPFLGAMIGVIWASVLFIIGMKEMHETSYGKSIATFLIPLLLCCGCFALVAAFFVSLFGLGMMNSLGEF